MIPIVGKTGLQGCRKQVLLDLETLGRRHGQPGLGATVKVDHHEQNFRYPGQSHCGRRLRQQISSMRTVEGGLAVLWDYADRTLGSPH